MTLPGDQNRAVASEEQMLARLGEARPGALVTRLDPPGTRRGPVLVAAPRSRSGWRLRRRRP